MFKRNLTSTFIALIAALAVSSAAHAAIEAGDVIAVDLSTAGGSAANYNAFNSQTTISPAVRLSDGTPVTGVSVSFASTGALGFNNDAAANAWSNTGSDPYYTGFADDISFGAEQTVTYAGLNDRLFYNVRIYSLISSGGTAQDDFSVTNGAGTVGLTGSTRASRWAASTLEAAGTVFNGVRTNGSGTIEAKTIPNTSNAFLNAVTLEASNIAFVGSLQNNPNGAEIGRWSRTSTAKTFDLDGDDYYGTDGYTWANTDDSSGGLKTVFHFLDESAPSYVSGGIAYTGFGAGASGSFSGAEDRLNSTDTGLENVGYMGVSYPAGNAGVQTLQEVFAYTMTRDMFLGETIRVGVVMDSLADTQIGADALRVVAGSTFADATLVAGSRTGVMDMYFFDIVGLEAGDQIQIWLSNATISGGFNAATIGGVTFDSINVPTPAALPAGLAILGLVATRRRRR